VKTIIKYSSIACLIILVSTSAMATNGDNLIAIGPNARAMGGVGIAHPLDAISAVFANPAALCFGPYCPSSEFNFSGTLFVPDVDAKVINAGGIATMPVNARAGSDKTIFSIPAIGFSVPLGSGPTNRRFGLAAYGVTGLGVDYRGTTLDNPGFYSGGSFPPSGLPIISGEYTSLQIMKFAPAVAFQPTSNLSVGLAIHIDYASLDLRRGSSPGYGFGIQPGLIFIPMDNVAIGLTYTSPQSVDHDDVTFFDNDNILDTLELEAPQQFGFGVSYEMPKKHLLVEVNVKWVNWSNAEGYKDFDWDDQWVFAVGARIEPVDNLFISLGYNYGESPVIEHNNFDGTKTAIVQGKVLPSRYYYETFRVIGFPAIVEHHLTLGIGYQFSDSLIIDLGYMHAFENTITERGTDLAGQDVLIESNLSEYSIDFGLTWRF
jgi:long-chain fatty acid transport protein